MRILLLCLFTSLLAAFNWQKTWTESLPQEAEVWILLSSSSWADVGQRMILLKKDSLDWSYVPPGGKAVTQTRTLPKTHPLWAPLTQHLAKSKELTTYPSQAMDGIEYQLLWVKKQENKTAILKDLTLNNPGLNQISVPQEQWIKTYVEFERKLMDLKP
jgi:hypothetical protein